MMLYSLTLHKIRTMLTRCPYPDCRQAFELADENTPRAGECQSCARPMNFRPLDGRLKMEERAERLAPHLFTSSTVPDVNKEPIIVIAEDVRSLWNVGSIFRTADGAGMSRLILAGITGNPPRKEIAKVSLGAEETVPWNYVSSALDAVLLLKQSGYQIVGLEKSDKSQSLTDALQSRALVTPLCLIIGNEVTGVSSEVLCHCENICHLPMRGMKESLNVAVAFGIAAYAIAEALLPQEICCTQRANK